MARLQILELPSGISDERPPFILVIDEAATGPDGELLIKAVDFIDAREATNACDVFVFEETVTIPANEPPPASTATGGRTCGEHGGPCFPEPDAKCVAHGAAQCLRCHRNPADCADDGNCSTWAMTGMHWDTCANRVRGPLASQAPDDHQTTQIVYAHERTRLDLCNALLLSGDTTWRQLIEQAGARQRELARVRSAPTEPELMNAEQERPDIWLHGYKCGILAARSAAAPRDEKASS